MSPQVLRILDANLNRAREGLRVLEDYARFALDDAALAEAIKTLRHELSAQTAALAGEAVLQRDTPGDVGTALTSPDERRRPDLASAVIAAGKRVGEAARVIEELLKIADPDAAARVGQVRYRLYEIERRLAVTFRPGGAFEGVRVCVLITESACRADWLWTAEQAIAGAAEAIQLREPGMAAGELLRRARRLVELCRAHGRLLIANDRPDVAMRAHAHGVHLGQADLPAAEVRRLVGREMIIGVSTHNLEQVRQARLDGADYVGVGPVLPSGTKPRPEMGEALPGLPFARAAAGLGLLPTVAIGGITLGNVADVWATGVSAVAVTAAVTQSDDPAGAARALRPAEG